MVSAAARGLTALLPNVGDSAECTAAKTSVDDVVYPLLVRSLADLRLFPRSLLRRGLAVRTILELCITSLGSLGGTRSRLGIEHRVPVLIAAVAQARLAAPH